MGKRLCKIWQACGESISERITTCREESGAHEENWWDMEAGVSSGAEIFMAAAFNKAMASLSELQTGHGEMLHPCN